MPVCLKCDKEIPKIDDKNPKIQCYGCKRQICVKCSGLLSTELRVIVLQSPTLKYLCPDCDLGVRQLPALRNTVSQLKNEIESLKSKQNHTNMENILEELAERKKRSTNVILFGIDECQLQTGDNVRDKEVRIEHDKVQVQQILNNVSELEALIAIIRLGKPKQSSPRPIKISNIEDYDRTYNIPKVIFKFVGIRMLREDTRRIRIICNVLYGVELFAIVSGIAQEAVQMALTARGASFQDVIDILQMMPCMGYAFLAMAKSYKMVVYRPVYERVCREMRALWPRGRLDPDEHRVLHDGLRELNFVIRCSYICNYVMWFIFMLPLLPGLARRQDGQDAPRTLPFYMWFPFDPLQPVVYEFLLAFQMWGGLFTVMLLVVADMMYCIFLGHLSCLLRLLSLRVCKLVCVPRDDQLPDEYPLGVTSAWQGAAEEAADAGIARDIERQHAQELREIIERHCALIRLVGDVELLNSFQMLLNFCNSSLIICACGFCGLVVEKMTELKYKTFLVTALIQTWLLCWYGQKIIDSSVGFAEALYGCGWYHASRHIRSTIIIMILRCANTNNITILRSQREVHITTYGFSVVSLTSYTTIVKSAWSYFTLLLNLNEE